MSTNLTIYEVETVGVVAGQVWHYLDETGSVTLSKLARELERSIDAPRDLTMQALGWLAREGKIEFLEGYPSKFVRLVKEPVDLAPSP